MVLFYPTIAHSCLNDVFRAITTPGKRGQAEAVPGRITLILLAEELANALAPGAVLLIACRKHGVLISKIYVFVRNGFVLMQGTLERARDGVGRAQE